MVLFLSDIHLISRGCKSEKLLSFLNSVEPSIIYLVGDVFDLWVPNNWDTASTKIIHRISELCMKGTYVYYVTGNHDSEIRKLGETSLGLIKIQDFAEFYTTDGDVYLVIHGDQFDIVNRWLTKLGGTVYDAILVMNDWLFKVRNKLGINSHWSLSDYAKKSSKKVLNFIINFKYTICEYANMSGYDGVICGHVHTPEITDVNIGTSEVENYVHYINCGDWVENCTAVIYENSKFRLEKF